MTDRDVQREIEENEERAEAHTPDRNDDTSIPGLIESAVNPLLRVFDPNRPDVDEAQDQREENDDDQRASSSSTTFR